MWGVGFGNVLIGLTTIKKSRVYFSVDTGGESGGVDKAGGSLSERYSMITVVFRGEKSNRSFSPASQLEKDSPPIASIFIRSKRNLLIGDPTHVIGEIEK